MMVSKQPELTPNKACLTIIPIVALGSPLQPLILHTARYTRLLNLAVERVLLGGDSPS